MTSLFEEVFEHSPVAKILVTASGNIALANKQAERLFQYDRRDLVGSKIEMLVPEASRIRHPDLMREYLNAPLPRQMGKGRDLYGLKKDKNQFPIEVGLTPIEVEDELHILCSVIDITDRKKAEERFRAAVDAAPNGMLMINSERRIVLINKNIEQIFGYSRKELIGQSIELLVPDEFKLHHPNFVESYLQRPESRAMGIGRELFGRHQSGKLVPVEIGLQPVDSDGEMFIISSVVDITYRRQVEAQIKRKTEEVEAFSYRASHDLNSPLKSIAAMSACICEDIDAGEYKGAKENASRISELSERLMTLIADIMTLTKVESSDEPVSEFDFDAFAVLAREKVVAELESTGTRLEFNLLHRFPLIVQPTRLTQVLDNLISNAIKYGDPENETRFVRVHTFNDRSKFYIHIEDNGTGIPEDRQPEVFDMFKRFHSPSIPGNGLGLHIVRKHVDMLGAEIDFDSSPNGTTFYIEIPREPTEAFSATR